MTNLSAEREDEQPVFKSLPVKLTWEELTSMKNNLAIMVEKQIETESQKSISGKDFSALLKDLKDSLKEVSKKISDGYESRPVECLKKLDFTRGMAYIIRTDLNEIVEERPLDEVERQTQMDFLSRKADKLA